MVTGDIVQYVVMLQSNDGKNFATCYNAKVGARALWCRPRGRNSTLFAVI